VASTARLLYGNNVVGAMVLADGFGFQKRYGVLSLGWSSRSFDGAMVSHRMALRDDNREVASVIVCVHA